VPFDPPLEDGTLELLPADAHEDPRDYAVEMICD
jgi:hypothetical protein